MSSEKNELLVQKVDIAHILPCLADTEKLRFIAYFDRDISEILPYLNTILKGAIYNHEGKTLTIKKGGRLITLHSHKLAAGKILDEQDAREIVEWLKDLINHCHANRRTIEPDFERRQKLGALDVYKLLPGTNCRRCGEPTCLAFAVKLTGEEADMLRCPGLFSGEEGRKRDELFRLLKSSGYPVPRAFSIE